MLARGACRRGASADSKTER